MLRVLWILIAVLFDVWLLGVVVSRWRQGRLLTDERGRPNPVVAVVAALGILILIGLLVSLFV
jgi:hypothetical protein